MRELLVEAAELLGRSQALFAIPAMIQNDDGNLIAIHRALRNTLVLDIATLLIAIKRELDK